MHSRARLPAPPRVSPWAGWLASAVALLVTLWPLSAAAEPTDAFTRALARGPLYATGAALLGGLLVSLTPCVYPMIAITVSVFGARRAKGRGQAMLLSTAFVAGIIAMFVPLGVVAGLTGSLFGSLLSNRWVNVALAVIFAALASSMLGAFEMVLPDRVMQKLGGMGGLGYGGAFTLGLVCGVMAAPCTGPVLTGILLWIGKTQSAWLGAGAMTAFSVGLGIPFWLVGAFAVSLPKGGVWMTWIKSFFGIVMLVVALYFLKFALPVLTKVGAGGTTVLLVALGAVVLGFGLGAVHLDWQAGTVAKVRKGLGVTLATLGAFTAIVHLEGGPADAAAADAAQTAQGPLLQFLDSEEQATALAREQKRPLLIDFTADWCKACKRLSNETFADARVRSKAGHFVALKIDVSVREDLADEEQERLEAKFDEVKKRHGVVGLPTVIVLDSTGKERLRLNDFVGPDEFLKMLDGIE